MERYEIRRLVWMYGPAQPSQKLLLLYLTERADQQGLCFPSIPRIHERTGISRAQVHRVLNSLETDSWLVRFSGRGRHKRNHYRIGLDKLLAAELEAKLNGYADDDSEPVDNSPENVSPRDVMETENVSPRDENISPRDRKGLTMRRHFSHVDNSQHFARDPGAAQPMPSGFREAAAPRQPADAGAAPAVADLVDSQGLFGDPDGPALTPWQRQQPQNRRRRARHGSSQKRGGSAPADEKKDGDWPDPWSSAADQVDDDMLAAAYAGKEARVRRSAG